MPKKKKPKKDKLSGFTWLRARVEKILDNSTVTDITEASIVGGLAILGALRLNDWKGALLGPISYKLATVSGGGMLDPSRMAGIAGLLLLGASVAGNPNVPPEEGGGQGFWEKSAQLKCKEGYVLDWNVAEGWHCKPIRGPPG